MGAIGYVGEPIQQDRVQPIAVAPCRRAAAGEVGERFMQLARQFLALQVNAVLPRLLHGVAVPCVMGAVRDVRSSLVERQLDAYGL